MPELSRLPSISELLGDPRLAALPHAVAVRAAREEVARAREALRAGGALPEDLAGRAAERARALLGPRVRRVVNATGVVLHTNLGRAPLSAAAARAAAEVAAGYCTVELDLDTGGRGERLDAVRDLLRVLTGAEDAVAVNNNAAAVLLACTALARGREVVVSRGELVEIGGSFRVPEVVASGGATLVEVGTTNRTRVADYAAATGERTAMLLRVHRSNFEIVGFTERPARRDLARLARERGVPLVEDLGSGLLAPLPGVADEELVPRAVADGADLVCFSGDKLLGGPQAGIVVGRADLVRRLRRHPLYRALRLDKLVVAALEATLRTWAEGRADAELPARRALLRPAEELRAEAERIAAAVPGARVEEAVGRAGGGSLPLLDLPGWVVVLEPPDPLDAAAALRRADPPVVARVARDRLVVDPRTLLPGEADAVIAALRGLVAVAGDRG